jgi:hypothetical protein
VVFVATHDFEARTSSPDAVAPARSPLFVDADDAGSYGSLGTRFVATAARYVATKSR